MMDRGSGNYLGEDEYIKYLQSIPVAKTHTGYFSVDGKDKMVNSKVGRKETTSDDVSAYGRYAFYRFGGGIVGKTRRKGDHYV